MRPAIAVAALLITAGAALAANAIHGTVTYDKVGYEYRNVVLSIVRNGNVFSRHLGRAYFTRPKLHVRDLDADGEPEVWVDTYTGGAHCCDESRFFRYSRERATYLGTLHSWGNVAYRAKNIDGRDGVELVSSDDRFAYVFTDFADSFFPLEIWHFDGGALHDVTRLFPGEVEHDANELWSTYLEHRGKRDVRGVLAAWQADQYLLGRQEEGWKMLATIRKRGELGPRTGFAGWPQGTSYVKALRGYLVKTGYAG